MIIFNPIMRKTRYIPLLFLTFLSLFGWSQNKEVYGMTSNEYYHLLNSQTATSTNVSQQVQGSSVYINQIGENNQILSVTTATRENSTFTQYGNSNSITVSAVAQELNQQILQVGEANHLQNYSYNPSGNQNLQVSQQGINQDITIFGENSMSENMKINMQGNDSFIIIRNF